MPGLRSFTFADWALAFGMALFGAIVVLSGFALLMLIITVIPYVVHKEFWIGVGLLAVICAFFVAAQLVFEAGIFALYWLVTAPFRLALKGKSKPEAANALATKAKPVDPYPGQMGFYVGGIAMSLLLFVQNTRVWMAS